MTSETSQIHDPDQFLIKYGKGAYLELIATAEDLSGARYKARCVLKGVTQTDHNLEQVLEALADYHADLLDARDRDTVKQEMAAAGFKPEMLNEFIAERAARARLKQLERDLPRLLDGARQELVTGAAKPVSVAQRLRRELEEFTHITVEEEPPFSVDAMLAEVKVASRGKLTGLSALDAKRVKIYPSELSIAAARTGHGKTSLLVNQVVRWLKAHPDELFLFYSYEVPPVALFIKIICTMTGIQVGARWSFTEALEMLCGEKARETYPDTRALNEVIDLLRSFQDRLLLIYRPGWNVDQLSAHAHQVVGKGRKVGGIFVDYLQIVPPPPGDYDRRDIAISHTARSLKHLAVLLNTPVITAAQLGRQAATDSGPIPPGDYGDDKVMNAIRKRRPELHHLREGGSEQEADLVFGLLNYAADYTEEADNPDSDRLSMNPDKPTLLELFILKSRFGERNYFRLGFDGKTGAILDEQAKGRKK